MVPVYSVPQNVLYTDRLLFGFEKTEQECLHDFLLLRVEFTSEHYG